METEVKTMVATETLAEWYLRESWAEMHGQEYGKKIAHEFRLRLRDGERLGQAFYNSLLSGDQLRVASTMFDPFHHERVVMLHRSIEFLTTKRQDGDKR